ncbi:MAG: DUF488 domain-containing protein [Planctomycetaceae bacterium]|nr:DUF488 domain-containing protein [Planctomycetaceae bacterium]
MSHSTKPNSTLYTIGHSNHDLESFIALLHQHGIQVLADVRSQPYSAYTTHFNREELQAAVISAGLKYVFMGEQLGGRPVGEQFYDEAGHVLYYKVAASPNFLEGVQRLLKGVQDYRVVIMCSEEDPGVCHRFLLVTRVMEERGVEIRHIRGDGSIESEGTVCANSKDTRHQPVLFAEMENDSWKSLRSVLHKVQPNDVSGD